MLHLQSAHSRTWALLLAGLLGGCTGDTSGDDAPGLNPDAPGASASLNAGTFALSPDGATRYTVHPELGFVSRLGADDAMPSELDLGGWPTRVLEVDGLLFVTLRTEGAVAVVQDLDGRLQLLETVAVGSDPVDLLLHDGRLYVASGTQGQVAELDASSLETLRTWSFPDQPRWLAMHPSGDSLYVASAMAGTWGRIELGTGVVHEHSLPTSPAIDGDFLVDAELQLKPRITGDIDVAPDGLTLAIPSLYVDNITPVGGDADDSGGSSGYGSAEDTVVLGQDRFSPAVTTVALQADGSAHPSHVRRVGVQKSADLMFGLDPTPPRRGYISALRYAPHGQQIVAAMPGANMLAVLETQRLFDPQEVGSSLVFDLHAAAYLDIVGGPQDAQFAGGVVHTHTLLSRDLVIVPRVTVSELLTQVHDRADDALAMSGFAHDMPNALWLLGLHGSLVPVVQRHAATRGALPLDVEEGRQLFYASADSTMSNPASGASCATCHFEGRSDGLSWPLEGGERQTLSMAGVVSDTAPFTWSGDVPTIAHEAAATSEQRMGGSGIAWSEAQAIEAWIDFIPAIPAPTPIDPNAVQRGQELFFSSQVGCGVCHSPGTFTDGQQWSLYGPTVNTPSLRGVGSTAPYLSDGSIDTLRQVLRGATQAGMGDTSDLTVAELDDLEAFLTSL